MTTTQTEIESVTDEELLPYEDDYNPNARAHIVDFLVNKAVNTEAYGSCQTATDIVDVARLMGLEVIAVCGYKWVPKRNPLNHETCEKCLEIWKRMK